MATFVDYYTPDSKLLRYALPDDETSCERCGKRVKIKDVKEGEIGTKWWTFLLCPACYEEEGVE